MRLKNKQQAFLSYCKIRFMNKRAPMAVRWQLTNRCFARCKYCKIWQNPEKEMTLEQIVSILDEMASMGTQTISYSGGEPMLRKDIGQILEETARRGISTEMNSTGAGVAENIVKLKRLDFLKVSLDGPEEIHDFVRGENSFGQAIEAAAAAKANKVRFIFTTTLTKYNIKEVDFVLETAKKFNTLVGFQPLKDLYRGVEDINALAPRKEDYRVAIKKLIDHKKRGSRYLRNSLTGLWHIYQWPDYPALKCWGGRIFCMLNTNGILAPCDRIVYPAPLPNCLDAGFREAFFSLPEPHCNGCGFCGVLELNFLMSFQFDILKTIYSVLK